MHQRYWIEVAAARRTAGFLAGHPLTRDHPLRAALRVVRWQIASRLHEEVVVRWVGGTKLAVRRRQHGAAGNIYAGLHEFQDMAFALHLLRRDDLFCDIGANVGSYTVLAAGVRQASTVAFEPEPEALAGLQRNVQVNRLAYLVEIRATALGAVPGEVVLTAVNGQSWVMDAWDGSNGGARHVVVMETLDRALAGRVPILIKLTVEGYEARVLAGATATLANPALKAILSEDGDPPVADLLAAHGFEQYIYDPFPRALTRFDGCGGANHLFVRDPDCVRSRLATAPAVQVLGREI